jgi:hypothetical protein
MLLRRIKTHGQNEKRNTCFNSCLNTGALSAAGCRLRYSAMSGRIANYRKSSFSQFVELVL